MAEAKDDWFVRLFREQGAAVRRHLRRVVGSADVAEELAQEAFARVYAVEAATIQSPRNFLFRTAQNLAVNHVRHEKMAATSLVDDVESVVANQASGGLPAPTAEDQLGARQELAILRDAIDSLPPQCRQVFVLRRIEQLSYREIADQLNVSVSTVEKHVARGVQLCHERLQQAREPRAMSPVPTSTGQRKRSR